jgi:hypothetical protein
MESETEQRAQTHGRSLTRHLRWWRVLLPAMMVFGVSKLFSLRARIHHAEALESVQDAGSIT